LAMGEVATVSVLLLLLLLLLIQIQILPGRRSRKKRRETCVWMRIARLKREPSSTMWGETELAAAQRVPFEVEGEGRDRKRGGGGESRDIC
jgi:hypothetical protein